jgi:thiopeptide-type bacteriocin biosynthesis protein
VLLDDGDNELPVDLNNAISVESFVDLVKSRPYAFLVEMFPGPEALCAAGPEGRFVHELVVPFVCADGRRPVAATASVPMHPSDRHHPRQRAQQVARRFAPGSEWLYAKLYTGVAAADQVLREVVGPLVRAATQAQAIDRWFFIRYADPDQHLRLRFHGAPDRLYRDLLPALYAAAAPLLEDGRIWRIQLDTYEREVERYGGAAGIELAEQIFHADSQAVLAIVERSAGDAALMQRWRLALRGVDQLLLDLGFGTEARHALIRRARDGYAREFRAEAGFARQLGDAYRRQRPNLEHLLSLQIEQDAALAVGLSALRARSACAAPALAALRDCEQAGALSLADMALSLAHMHVNRMLRSAQRQQELVIYEFLDRLYSARAARSRSGH